jgi:hypothetical protein
VGGKHCKRGIFKAEINNESMTLSLQNVGIQCVKRSNVDEALKERESQRIDPFKSKLIINVGKNSVEKIN